MASGNARITIDVELEVEVSGYIDDDIVEIDDIQFIVSQDGKKIKVPVPREVKAIIADRYTDNVLNQAHQDRQDRDDAACEAAYEGRD
jgi:hypothetical protein